MSKKREFFWASYADLMTSLFFIMLVLFVLAVVMFKNEQKELEKQKEKAIVKAKTLDKIKEIKESIGKINKEYFEYNEKYKKHILKIENIEFKKRSYDINDLSQKVKNNLIKAGQAIKNKIDEISRSNKSQDIQYLIIIEGQASKTGSTQDNFTLSYNRALTLKRFWKENNLDFENENEIKNCELIVAGSGEGGSPRDLIDEKNKRFLVHIIPKIGKIDNDE